VLLGEGLHAQVVSVHVVAGLDGLGGETDRLAVAMYGFARSDLS
jgi:hypothetical protein